MGLRRKLLQSTSTLAYRCGRFLRLASTASSVPPQNAKTRYTRAAKKTKEKEKRQELVCAAFAIGEEYNLAKLHQALEQDQSFSVSPLPQDIWNAVHVTVQSDVTENIGEVFFFRFGTVVSWNVPQSRLDRIMDNLLDCLSGPYPTKIVEWENETMPYAYKSGHSRLQHDTILLDNNSQELLLEKYAFSDAMSLSVKLAMWESALDDYVKSVLWVPQTLKLGKTLKISRKEVLQKTGEIITLRHEMNLMPDVLGTPDFYWDRPELEQLYKRMCHHLDVPLRRQIVNEKLDYCSELAELLRTHMGQQHSNRLEWLIIILITIEVLMDGLHIMF